eukprot:CAMPEP_0170525062 /NCGR_PEP_ID=MMETSP0209-20121228/10526_1 /TAXON_ID=665100 ORGANISM="Litonotus pictus, Strain P1" /NCGR_SAMPLE_ID=MMETSP0209 /ASSEMBLY_ACC=CAM_ASM_000301 /LENGTH=1742 /DNA_ID=CAMNT_0010814105 /DNA_START=910 /DNA_END=6135 /DNA_ORIENTATION=+
MNMSQFDCKIFCFGVYSEHVKQCKDSMCKCWNLAQNFRKSNTNNIPSSESIAPNHNNEFTEKLDNTKSIFFDPNLKKNEENDREDEITNSKKIRESELKHNNTILSQKQKNEDFQNMEYHPLNSKTSFVNEQNLVNESDIAKDNNYNQRHGFFPDNNYDLFDNENHNSLFSKKIWIELWIDILTNYIRRQKRKNLPIDKINYILLLHLINLLAFEVNNPYQAIIELKDIFRFIEELNNKDISYFDMLTIKFFVFNLEDNVRNLIIQNQNKDSEYYNMFFSLTSYCRKYEIFLSNLVEVNDSTMKFLLFIFDKKRSQVKNLDLIINRLSEMNDDINKLTFKTLDSYHKLTTLEYDDYKVFYLFAKFFEHVYLIPMIKNELEERFEASLRTFFNQNKNNLSNNFEKIKLKSFDNPFGTAITVISGNFKDLGNIKYVNNYFEKISGYTIAEMLHKNINIIMPDSVGKYHNIYLKSFFISENSSVLDHMRMIVLKRKDKFLVLVDILVKIYPSFSDGLNFIGYIIEKNNASQSESQSSKNIKHGFMLISNDTHIEGISPEITYSTNLLPELIPKTTFNKKNSELNSVVTIIPNYDNDIHDIINNFSYEKVIFERYSLQVFDQKNSRKKDLKNSRYIDNSSSILNINNSKTYSNLSNLLRKNKIDNFSKNLGGVLAEIEEIYDNDNNDDTLLTEKMASRDNKNNKIIFADNIKSLSKKYDPGFYFNRYELSFYCKLREFRIEKSKTPISFLFVNIHLKKVKHNTHTKKHKVRKSVDRREIIESSDEWDKLTKNTNDSYFLKNQSITDDGLVNTSHKLTVSRIMSTSNSNREVLSRMNSNQKGFQRVDRTSNVSSTFIKERNEKLQKDKQSAVIEEKNEEEEKNKFIQNKQQETKYMASLKLTDFGIKVKNVKHEGVKNMIKLFRSFDLNIDHNVFSKLTLFFKIVSLITILFYVFIYIMNSNLTNSKKIFLNKKMLYIDFITSLSSKSEIFYALIMLNLQINKYETELKYQRDTNSTFRALLGPKGEFPKYMTTEYQHNSEYSKSAKVKQLQIDSMLDFKNIYHAKSLMTEFMKNYTEESNIDVLRAMELPGSYNDDHDILHSQDLQIYMADKNYDIRNKNTSLIKMIDFYNYQFRKILSINTQNDYSILYQDNPQLPQTYNFENLFDFSVDENIQTYNIILNLSNNIISYIYFFTQEQMAEKDSYFERKQAENTGYLIGLSVVVLFVSVWLSFKLNNLFLNNKKILHLFLIINNNLIKKRIRVLANFTALLSKFGNLNFLNAKIKADFILRLEHKKAKRKLAAMKQNQKTELESTSQSVTSVTSMSSLSSNGMDPNEIDFKLLSDMKWKINNNIEFKNDSSGLDAIQKAYGLDVRKDNSFNTEEKYDYILDKQEINIDKIVRWDYLIGLTMLIFMFYTSYFIILLIINSNQNKTVEDFALSVEKLSFKRVSDGALINSVMLQWYSSLNSTSFDYSVPPSPERRANNIKIDSNPELTELKDFSQNIARELMEEKYKSMNIHNFITGDTIYELFSKIEYFEERYRQEYTLQETLHNNNITIGTKSIFCDFYFRFIQLMIDRLGEEDSETFLSRERTLAKLEVSKFFYDNCLIKDDNMATFASMISMSKKDFFSLYQQKKVDFINSEIDFNLAFKSLMFRTCYVANVNFMIRLFGIQINFDLYRSEINTILMVMIILIIVNFIFYIVVDCFLLKSIVYNLLYKRSVIMIIPIENILEANPEFDPSNRIF